MASTISTATLTVQIAERIRLDDEERGATTVLSVASVQHVDKRLVTVPTTAKDIILFHATDVGPGQYVRGNVKYVRITNRDDTNYVILGLHKTGADTVYVQLNPGESFILTGGQNFSANTNDSAFTAFVQLDRVTAQANTAAVIMEVFVAST